MRTTTRRRVVSRPPGTGVTLANGWLLVGNLAERLDR